MHLTYLATFLICGMLSKATANSQIGTADNDTVSGNSYLPLEVPTESPDAYSLAHVEETDLDTWEAPDWMKKSYPLYLSGYDVDGRPIWIAEWGKYDMRKIALGGKELTDSFDKYVAQQIRLIYNHTLVDGNPTQEADFILDFDELPLDQITSIPSITYIIRLGEQYRQFLESKIVARVIILNANYAAHTFVRITKKIFGRVFEKVEIYGTNKASWIAKLLRLFPQDQLPEWYGGVKQHKPVLVYG